MGKQKEIDFDQIANGNNPDIQPLKDFAEKGYLD